MYGAEPPSRRPRRRRASFRSHRTLRRGEGLLGGEWAPEVHACGLPYAFAEGVGTPPAQEGVNRPAGKFHPLEGGVFLGGEEAFGRHRVSLVHVYDGEVGVCAEGDRTLAGAQAVGARRVRRDEFHAAQQRETVFRALGKDEGIDQSRPAETGECLPEVTLFVLLRAAGVVGADPIDLTACHTAPERPRSPPCWRGGGCLWGSACCARVRLPPRQRDVRSTPGARRCRLRGPRGRLLA